MTNSLVENFFREMMDYPFARMMAEGVGTPTVKLEMDFKAPLAPGRRARLDAGGPPLGRSSAKLRIAPRARASSACRAM
jgi:4-hydroxybenzoyl-CoA thioesterase